MDPRIARAVSRASWRKKWFYRCSLFIYQISTDTIKIFSKQTNFDTYTQSYLLVRFGGISDKFGRAMVSIFARRSRAKLPMAKTKEPDMPPKSTEKGTPDFM